MNIKLLLALMGLSASLCASNVVNVYTHRHYDTDKQLYKAFTKQTGIKVQVVKAKANELISRMQTEGKNSPADVFITSDAGNLYQAKAKGLLQSIDSPYLEKAVPQHLQDKDNQWFALTKRARVIAYAKDRVKKEELSTYEDLVNQKWKKRIMVRSSNNVYNQSLLASLIAHHGEQKAKKWAKGVVENMAKKPRSNDMFQIKAVALGLGDIAIVNTYYMGKMLTSKSSADVDAAHKVDIFFPNQKGRGAHINISGAGVAKYSKNKKNAIKLIEFLLSEKAQKSFAQANFEYPVLKGVEPSEIVKAWGSFKEDNLPINKLGEFNSQAVKIFDMVGWR